MIISLIFFCSHRLKTFQTTWVFFSRDELRCLFLCCDELRCLFLCRDELRWLFLFIRCDRFLFLLNLFEYIDKLFVLVSCILKLLRLRRSRSKSQSHARAIVKHIIRFCETICWWKNRIICTRITIYFDTSLVTLSQN